MVVPEMPESDPLGGRFSNTLSIGFNAYVFVFDFGTDVTGDEPQAHTRVVTSPASAQDFCDLLRDSLDKHNRQCAETGKGTEE